MIRKFSEKELEQFVRHLSKLYKKSALRIKLDPDHLLKHDRDFVYTINVCLEECSKDTKFIIKNEFLEKRIIHGISIFIQSRHFID